MPASLEANPPPNHSGKPPARQSVFEEQQESCDGYRQRVTGRVLRTAGKRRWILYTREAEGLGRTPDRPRSGRTAAVMSGSQPAGCNEPTPEQRSERLTVAALRSAASGRMWGGKGCGAPCDYCRVVVSA